LETASATDWDSLLTVALTERTSLLFDLSGRRNSQKQAIFAEIVGNLFQILDQPALRQPVKLIVEEARIFAPQQGTGKEKEGNASLDVLEDVATRGRKRGLHMLVATQRPASIHKDIISQCNRWWLGGVKSLQDCKALRPYLLDAGVTEEQIRALRPGEFYFYNGNGSAQKIKVRQRKCRHGGETPSNSNKILVQSRWDRDM
jgi:uncharacterized protein